MTKILLILNGNDSSCFVYQENGGVFFIKNDSDPDGIRGYKVICSGWDMCWWKDGGY